MIAPDETTFAYLKGRRFAPKAAAWDEAIAYWATLKTDDAAGFDQTVEIDAASLEPFVTWGTSPGMVAPITGNVPDPAPKRRVIQIGSAAERALEYMALAPRTSIEDIHIDRVFIGSCTNARIEDLRAAARVVNGYRITSSVHAMVVPGSQSVKRAAEAEGLDHIFREAGFEWREAGCSMCLGMNPEYCNPGNVALRQAIETSKDDRDEAAARIWSVR